MSFSSIKVTKFDKTDSGTIKKAGYRAVSFLNKGATNVTVDGRVYPPGFGECYPDLMNGTYGNITYNANGGLIWFTCYSMDA